ncbi:MAG: Uma2 family endonuclease [Cyanobacteria bacterium SBLK]|nr:Uma2 family endonuclease [Cyanobacteria bacterium SBLK]
MTIAVSQPLLLEKFLHLPYIEESPAWEFINGEAVQKPMPGVQHSRLQFRLASVINSLGSIYEALPELRCTFGERSLIPDIAIVKTARIPINEGGEIPSTGIEFAPNWAIEILSPNQGETKVTRNILHALRHGCQLGWLIDPAEKIVLVFRPDRLPDEFAGTSILPVLEGIELELTPDTLFNWLQR